MTRHLPAARLTLATLNSATVESLNDDEIASTFDNSALDATASLYDRQHTLEGLARLSPAEYAQKRAGLAEELGIGSVSFLDAEWKERRKGGASSSAGEMFAPDEPWSTPVDGARLLDGLVRRIKRHVIFSDEAAAVVALWVVFAWSHDTAIHSPMLLASSAEANSGKTTLLGLIRFLVPRPLFVVQISGAVLFRAIEKWRPTIIVDEADDVFKENIELRGVINSGWTRGAGVPRCNPDTHEPEFFSTFGPKAIGMKGKNIPDTTMSRSIVIEMVRKGPGENAEDFEHIDDDELASFRRLLARWTADNMSSLEGARPILPDGFQNRLAANWRPLLAVADRVGGGWPERARSAAVVFAGRVEEQSRGTMLLMDIRSVYAEKGTDRVPSAELAEALSSIEGRPWAEWGKAGKPITANQLARLLKPFTVSPENIYIGTGRADAKRPKGYLLDRFADAFARYLPPEGAPEPLNRYTPTAAGISEPFQSAQQNGGVAVGNGEKPLSNGPLSGVAVQNRLGGPRGVLPRCAHCGQPGPDGAFLTVAEPGGDVLLHRGCLDGWQRFPTPSAGPVVLA